MSSLIRRLHVHNVPTFVDAEVAHTITGCTGRGGYFVDYASMQRLGVNRRPFRLMTTLEISSEWDGELVRTVVGVINAVAPNTAAPTVCRYFDTA